MQFLFVACTSYGSQFDSKRPPFFLKPNRVPIRRWLVNILLFFTINVLNNHAFSYNISVPIHIILRSGGSITTLVAGYLWGKRFSRLQIISVTLLTVGVIIAAWSDQQSKVKGFQILVPEGFLLTPPRARSKPSQHSHHSVPASQYCSLHRFCLLSWGCIRKRHTKNMGLIGKRTCSILIFSHCPYSCHSFHP